MDESIVDIPATSSAIDLDVDNSIDLPTTSSALELILDESIDFASTSSNCGDAVSSLNASSDAPPHKKKNKIQTLILEKIQESNDIIKKEIEKSAEMDAKMLKLQEDLVSIKMERNEILKSLLNLK